MPDKRRPSTPLRDIRRESSVEPPPRARIDALPPLGVGTAAFDLSGLSLVIEGLEPGLAAATLQRFHAWRCAPGDAPSPLRVSVHADSVGHYVEPDTGESPEGYYRLRIVHEDGLIRMVTYGMAAWLDIHGLRGGVAFGRGTFDPRERALENLCRVAIAWMAIAQGGFLIHGASIEREGRAYVFFGRSASGKSTLCSLNTEGRVISDDLSLVLPGPAGLEVAGTPFRGTYREGPPVRGAFPLAGMFLLVQSDRTSVEELPAMTAFAEYVANLPFVNDALHAYPGLMERLGGTIERVPVRALRFTKSPGWWSAVDASLASAR